MPAPRDIISQSGKWPNNLTAKGAINAQLHSFFCSLNAATSEFDSAMSSAGSSLVVVDFTASWCGPCKAIAPTFASLASAHPTVLFLKVDVDRNRSISQAYNISAMPTFLFFKNKSIIDKIRGADPAKLTQLVRQHDTGKGPSGGFPGGGQTIGGGAAATSSSGAGAGFQVPTSIEGIATENLLPLLVLVAYLVYVFWPN